MLSEKFIERTHFASYEDFKANYKVSVPEDFNFAAFVDEYAEIEPNKLALLWCSDTAPSRAFTFSDISILSQKAAAFLIDNGIGKGDRVMLLLRRRYDYWITALALHRIGAVLIPASFQLTAKDIAYRIDAASVKMIITADDDAIMREVALGAKGKDVMLFSLIAKDGFSDYSAYRKYSKRFIIDKSIRSKDIMLMYFTSGTTGMPKMVVHSYAYPLGHIVTAKYWQGAFENGLHFTNADSGWAKFSWGSYYGQWLSGSAVLGYDQQNKFSARNLINVIKKYRPTTLCLPGTIYRLLVIEGIERDDFSSVTHCCTAGEPLAPKIMDEFYEHTGLKIHEGFGQTESTVLVANFSYFPAKEGYLGKPSPVYDIAVIDKNGEECHEGDSGEIVIRNPKGLPGLLIGYYENNKLVSPYDEKGYYHTGDVVWIDTDGFYKYVGRNDDIIKCSGYRIGPFEIESILLTHPAVLECAITAAPDPVRGQVVKASIVLRKGFCGGEELTSELQTYVKHLTAPYKYPRIIEYMKELPKTTSGKIQRNVLRTMTD